MTISAGNLDELVNVSGSVLELYGVELLGDTIASGSSTDVLEATVVINGTDAPGTDSAGGQEFTVASVDDDTDVATLSLIYPNALVGTLDDATVVGFSDDALLLYTNGTGSLLASSTTGPLNAADFAVFSAAPLATGTTLTFTESGVFTGLLTPPVEPSATQATVTGAGGVTLLVDFADATLASTVQPQFTAISDAIAAGSADAEAVADGLLPTLPQGVAGLAEIDDGGDVLLKAGYTTAIDLADGATSLIAGTGAASQLIVAGGTGPVTYSAAAGVDTVYSGAGDMVVYGNSSALDFLGGDGGATIVGGAGGNAISGGGGDQLVFANAALDWAGGTGDASVVGLSGDDTITGGSAGLLLFSAGGSYAGGSGAATIVGVGGPLNANMGAGGGVVFASAEGGNVLSSGSGAAVLVGGGAGDQLIASGSAGDDLIAGGGAETLDGAAASGTLVLFGGSGADCMIGGAGGNLYLPGSANETLVSGSGPDYYAFIDAGATARVDTVLNFSTGSDVLFLFGYGTSSAADAAAFNSQVSSGGNTFVSLSDGTRIEFAGVAHVGRGNFA